MQIPALFGGLACLVLFLIGRTRGGILSPAAVTAFVMSLAFVGSLAPPARIAPVSVTAAIIVVLGVSIVVLSGSVAYTLCDSRLAISESRVKGRALTIIAVVAAVLCLLDAVHFRAGVSNYWQQDFNALSATEIRYAEQQIEPGLLGLMLSAGPLSAFSSVACGRLIGRRWYVLALAPIISSTATPARTGIGYVLVVALAAVAMVPLREGATSLGRGGAVVLGGIASLLFAGYFAMQGEAMGTAATGGGAAFGPIRYYLSGGLSALSVSIADGFNPLAANPGRSYYALVRLSSALGLAPDQPATETAYVAIPAPYNAYTAFGDIWHDAGLVGLALISILLGSTGGWAAARGRKGSLPWAWVASYLCAVAASSFVTTHILDLGTVFWGVLGFFVLRLAQRPSSPGTQLRGPSSPRQ